MKVTWEVQVWFIKWITICYCIGNMPLEVYQCAEEIKDRKSKGFGKLFRWRTHHEKPL